MHTMHSYPQALTCLSYEHFYILCCKVWELLMHIHTLHASPQVLKYFSYEHFYVIYCKFWELDSDHDFLIDRNDLAHYSQCALSFQIIDQIFEQVGKGNIFAVLAMQPGHAAFLGH